MADRQSGGADLKQIKALKKKKKKGQTKTRMADDIRNRLENLDEVNQAFVEITFDPPWSPERMTDKGKSKLGFDPKPPDEEQLKNWE